MQAQCMVRTIGGDYCSSFSNKGVVKPKPYLPNLANVKRQNVMYFTLLKLVRLYVATSYQLTTISSKWLPLFIMLIQHLKALKRGYLQISSHTKVINTEISFHKQTNNKIILDLKDKENIKYNNFSESTKLHVFKKVER